MALRHTSDRLSEDTSYHGYHKNWAVKAWRLSFAVFASILWIAQITP